MSRILEMVLVKVFASKPLPATTFVCADLWSKQNQRQTLTRATISHEAPGIYPYNHVGEWLSVAIVGFLLLSKHDLAHLQSALGPKIKFIASQQAIRLKNLPQSIIGNS